MQAKILARLSKLKKGATAADLAFKLSLKETTVRTSLWELARSGQIKVTGTRRTNGVGRPANVYSVV